MGENVLQPAGSTSVLDITGELIAELNIEGCLMATEQHLILFVTGKHKTVLFSNTDTWGFKKTHFTTSKTVVSEMGWEEKLKHENVANNWELFKIALLYANLPPPTLLSPQKRVLD